MQNDGFNRRSFLKTMSSAGMLAALPETAFGGHRVLHEVAESAQEAVASPKYSIKFAVCGMSHDHIYGMIGAVQRGGGELVAAWGGEAGQAGGIPQALSRREDRRDAGRDSRRSVDPARAQLADRQRARAARRPRHEARQGFSLRQARASPPSKQLAEVRKTIAETKRIYAHHVQRAARGEGRGLCRRTGAAGRHRQSDPDHQHRAAPDLPGRRRRRRRLGRPEWFWNPISTAESCATSARTRWTSSSSTPARRRPRWWSRRLRTCAIPIIPQFQDFGDMVLRGDRGFGYVRLDWFTPDGLGTWGDGRLFILGTDGYIEVRKYTNVAVSNQGNNLFIVDQQAGPVHRLQQHAAAVRAAVRRRHREPHPHRAGPDAVPAGRGAGHQGAEERKTRPSGELNSRAKCQT